MKKHTKKSYTWNRSYMQALQFWKLTANYINSVYKSNVSTKKKNSISLIHRKTKIMQISYQFMINFLPLFSQIKSNRKEIGEKVIKQNRQMKLQMNWILMQVFAFHTRIEKGYMDFFFFLNHCVYLHNLHYHNHYNSCLPVPRPEVNVCISLNISTNKHALPHLHSQESQTILFHSRVYSVTYVFIYWAHRYLSE